MRVEEPDGVDSRLQTNLLANAPNRHPEAQLAAAKGGKWEGDGDRLVRWWGVEMGRGAHGLLLFTKFSSPKTVPLRSDSRALSLALIFPTLAAGVKALRR